MKKLLSLLTLVLVLVMCPATVSAEEIKKNSEDTKQTFTLNADLQSMDADKKNDEPNIRINRAASSNNIDTWECDISRISSGFIKGSAATSSAAVADELGLIIYFQAYENGRWNTVTSQSFREYNTDSIERVRNAIVPNGKEYRVRVQHYGIFNGYRETVWSTSSSIYLD